MTLGSKWIFIIFGLRKINIKTMKKALYFFALAVLAGLVSLSCEDDDNIIEAPDPEPEPEVFTGFKGNIDGIPLEYIDGEGFFEDSTIAFINEQLPPDSSRAFYASYIVNPIDSVYFGVVRRELAYLGGVPQGEEFFEFFTTPDSLPWSQRTVIFDTIDPNIPIIDTIDTVTPGIEIVLLDSDSTFWSSADGPQTTSRFEFEETRDIVTVLGFKIFNFKARINCILFDIENGQVQSVTDGLYSGNLKHF